MYYRVTGVDVSNGIYAKNADAKVRLTDYVRNGSKNGPSGNSQFVAMTRSFSVALKYALKGGCQGICLIDEEKIRELGIAIFDLSVKERALKTLQLPENRHKGKCGEGYYEVAANYAVASQEIDCVPGSNGIPKNCYKFVSYKELKKAYNELWDPFVGSAKANEKLMSYLLKIAQ